MSELFFLKLMCVMGFMMILRCMFMGIFLKGGGLFGCGGEVVW